MSSISSNSVYHKCSFHLHNYMWKLLISNNTVGLQLQFSSIWPTYSTLSGVITPGQSRPGSDGDKCVLRIPQSSSFTETSPSDFLCHILKTHWGSLSPLQRCSRQGDHSYKLVFRAMFCKEVIVGYHPPFSTQWTSICHI